MGEPSELIIQETTGESRNKLVFIGRALPYQPITFEGIMRAETTWYPGNPQATVQFLGPQEGSTTINGMWKDRFVRTSLPGLLPIPVLNPPGKVELNGTPLEDVASIVLAVDQFRRRGQVIELRWDEITRRGFISKFRHTWIRREDVEWEMEFTWVAQEERRSGISFGMDLGLLDLISELVNAVNDLIDAVAATFAQIRSIVNAINNAIDTIVAVVAALSDLVQEAVSLVLAPLEIARQIVAGYETIKDQCGEIADAITSVPARAQRIVADIKGVSQADAVQAEAYVNLVLARTRDLIVLAAQRQQELQSKFERQPAQPVVQAREGQDVRQLSRAAYKTSDEWKRITAYNRIKGSKLRAGQRLVIPRLQGPTTVRMRNARRK